MINITKEFGIDMSHRLEGFEGKCNNVHGHRYRLLVTVSRNDDMLDNRKGHNNGMVVDFSLVKDIVEELIVDKMDHAFVYNSNDSDSKKIAKFLIKLIDQKCFALPFRTTAENMSAWMYKELNKRFNNLDIKCRKIVLFETPTSFAKYK